MSIVVEVPLINEKLKVRIGIPWIKYARSDYLDWLAPGLRRDFLCGAHLGYENYQRIVQSQAAFDFQTDRMGKGGRKRRGQDFAGTLNPDFSTLPQ